MACIARGGVRRARLFAMHYGPRLQFCWIDDRWTPEAALDLTQTRFEAAMAAQNAFPEGCLKRPRPENQVAQAFALDVAF